MVHIHSNNSLQNTIYNDRFGVNTYSRSDLEILKEIRVNLIELHQKIITEHQISFLNESKSSVFILEKDKSVKLENELGKLSFVKEIVNKAIHEVDIYVRNGFKIVEIENVGAPYFIHDDVPLEDLAIINLVAKSIRKHFPDLITGVHVLAGDELESLPIALDSESYFIRSETSIFSGFRPEGRMLNRGNLAKFFYLRNYLNTFLGIEDPKERRYPQIWSDLQKKHTVFEQELSDLDIWLNNMLFLKLEGIILTGSETGKDINELDLEKARKAVEEFKEVTRNIFGEQIDIPLITGSGLNVESYKRHADFVITGTQLKEKNYWENNVSEKKVQELISKFRD